MDKVHTDQEILALIEYVKDFVRGKRTKYNNIKKEFIELNTKTTIERIQDILDKQPPLEEEIIVYRGQDKDVIDSTRWISTSVSLKVAKDEFTTKKKGCCLFKITVKPGIKILDVNKFIEDYNKEYKTNYRIEGYQDEREIIIDKGGLYGPFVSKGKLDAIDYYEVQYSPAVAAAAAAAASSSKISNLEDEYRASATEDPRLKNWFEKIVLKEVKNYKNFYSTVQDVFDAFIPEALPNKEKENRKQYIKNHQKEIFKGGRRKNLPSKKIKNTQKKRVTRKSKIYSIVFFK